MNGPIDRVVSVFLIIPATVSGAAAEAVKLEQLSLPIPSG